MEEELLQGELADVVAALELLLLLGGDEVVAALELLLLLGGDDVVAALELLLLLGGDDVVAALELLLLLGGADVALLEEEDELDGATDELETEVLDDEEELQGELLELLVLVADEDVLLATEELVLVLEELELLQMVNPCSASTQHRAAWARSIHRHSRAIAEDALRQGSLDELEERQVLSGNDTMSQVFPFCTAHT